MRKTCAIGSTAARYWLKKMNERYTDRLLMQDIDLYRRERRERLQRRLRLWRVCERYDARIGASLSNKYRRVLQARRALVVKEMEGIDIELAYIVSRYRDCCTHAKLRGLITDRDMLAWQREDYA